MEKERIQQVVDALPEDVDVDALMERLYLLRKLELAEESLANQGGIPHEQAKQRLAKWLE